MIIICNLKNDLIMLSLFFMNLLHSPAVWLFDIWHTVSNSLKYVFIFTEYSTATLHKALWLICYTIYQYLMTNVIYILQHLLVSTFCPAVPQIVGECQNNQTKILNSENKLSMSSLDFLTWSIEMEWFELVMDNYFI